MAGASAAVDVRDMVCAQALAVVAKAVKSLPPGGIAYIRYSTPDVQQDLVSWAQQVGHVIEEAESGRLRLIRQPQGPRA